MIEDAHGFRERMACLADESRFRIVLALAGAEQCVSHLARAVGLSQSCTTRHLQALARLGLVQGNRRGRQVVFALRFDSPEIRWVLRAFDRVAPDPAHARPGPPAAPGRRPTAVAAEGPPAVDASAPVALDLAQPEAGDAVAADAIAASEREQTPGAPPSRFRSDLEDYLL